MDGTNDVCMLHRKKIIKQISLVAGVLAILSLILFVLLIIQNHTLQVLRQKENSVNRLVAPYYESDVFKKPPIPLHHPPQKMTPVKIPILMYHYVEYVKDDNDLIRKKLDINPALFEAHLRTLKNANYETYYVKDVPDILSGAIRYSTQSAILTFDDGYEDFYTDVFPLLKKYHMRATAYVIYNYIGHKGFMNEAQIRELIDSDLVEIGSHTLDHLYLKSIPNHIANAQILESKNLFEKRFGIKIKTFAYPYGAFNEANRDAVQKAGYSAAVSVIPGVMQSEENLFFLARIRPSIFTPSTMISTIESYRK